MEKKHWVQRQWKYEEELIRRQNLPENKEFNDLSFDDKIKQLRKGDVVYCTVGYEPITKIFGKKVPSMFAIRHEVKEIQENRVKVLEHTPISEAKKAIWANKNCITEIAYRE